MNNSSSSSNNENVNKASKSGKSKGSKKSTAKSRSKTVRSDANNATIIKNGNCSSVSGSGGGGGEEINNHSTSAIALGHAPLLKTSLNNYTTDCNTGTGNGSSGVVSTSSVDNNDSSVMPRNHHKNYTGLEPRSIKIIWEQHDQSDVELSHEVCARLAEDASYKLWELINNIKIYARHSGGKVTYDLVNEVMKDMDVPPCLGAMDSDWDHIDYDGSYFFPSDKILELRDEYQKDVTFTIPNGQDFECLYPIEENHIQIIKEYIPNLLDVILHGNVDDVNTALVEAAFSPIIGTCYRLLLTKIIQIMAFKQSSVINQRCWTLLKALATNYRTRSINCRTEYFHLSELIICQLLAPYEKIKVQKTSDNESAKIDDDGRKKENYNIKVQEQVDVKCEIVEKDDAATNMTATATTTTTAATTTTTTSTPDIVEVVYEVHLSDDDDEEGTEAEEENKHLQDSPYFAQPVEFKYVDDVCQTLSHLAAISGYFQIECIKHILKRLKRFFEGRIINCERDYNYISRSLKGLFALGECAFREFIPFIYKMNSNDIPETLWNDFAMVGIYLNGSEDIFLYEWLQYICGDVSHYFFTYYADYYENFLAERYFKRKKNTFKLIPKLGVRRLEWNTIAAAMCHGDDPNKALKPKPSLSEMFPNLIIPNLKLNRAGNTRFKFAGCNPIMVKAKLKLTVPIGTAIGDKVSDKTKLALTHDILIAKRKLYKPITNGKFKLPSYSYYHIRC